MYQWNGTVYREIPVSLLRPGENLLRERTDLKSLDELGESLLSVGVIQPLTVRYRGEGEYEIITGFRRYLAARRIGLERLPCLVSDAENGEAVLVSLVENIQRKKLNFFEEAEGIRLVSELLHLTQDQVAKRLGKSQSAVANKLRLLQLSEDLRSKIIESGLSERHARALLSVDGETARRRILRITVARGYRVSQMEALIEREKSERPPIKRKKKQTYKGFCRDLKLYLNTIDRTVDLLKNSGFRTECETSEDTAKIVYRIEIDKAAVTAG